MSAKTQNTPIAPFVPCVIEPRVWEDHVNKLMNIHWTLLGARYQAIPDRTGGDRGLEGFSTLGDAIQAYVDIESRTAEERRKGQLKKIRNDLAKLDKYSAWWETTLQGLKLKTWTVVVPAVDDANIVQYARKKGAELLAKGLPFIDSTFQAMVATDQDYPRALQLIHNPSLVYREIPILPVADGDVSRFTDGKPGFASNISRKVAAYVQFPTPTHLNAERDQQLRNHLKCANYLENLKTHFSNEWEQIEGIVESLADRLSTDNRASDAAPYRRVRELIDEFGSAIYKDVCDLPSDRRLMLANGIVARWLGDCTLEFASVAT